MTKNLLELYQERGRLQERIAGHRIALAREWAPLQNASDAGGRVLALLRRCVAYLWQHPFPVVGLFAVLLVLKPGRTWAWARRGLLLWRGWRALRRWLPQAIFRAL